MLPETCKWGRSIETFCRTGVGIVMKKERVQYQCTIPSNKRKQYTCGSKRSKVYSLLKENLHTSLLLSTMTLNSKAHLAIRSLQVISHEIALPLIMIPSYNSSITCPYNPFWPQTSITQPIQWQLHNPLHKWINSHSKPNFHFLILSQFSGSFNKRRPCPSCNNNNNKFKHVSFAINKIWFSLRGLSS